MRCSPATRPLPAGTCLPRLTATRACRDHYYHHGAPQAGAPFRRSNSAVRGGQAGVDTPTLLVGCGGRAGRRISHQRRRLRSPGVQLQGDQSASFTLVTGSGCSTPALDTSAAVAERGASLSIAASPAWRSPGCVLPVRGHSAAIPQELVAAKGPPAANVPSAAESAARRHGLNLQILGRCA